MWRFCYLIQTVSFKLTWWTNKLRRTPDSAREWSSKTKEGHDGKRQMLNYVETESVQLVDGTSVSEERYNQRVCCPQGVV